MITKFIEIIASILGILSILGTAVYAILKIGRLEGKVESKINVHDEKLKDLPCKENREISVKNAKDIAVLENQSTSLEKNIDDIKDDIKSIRQAIQLMLSGGSRGSSPLGQSQSPISLTDKGREYFEELGIQSMIDAHWDDLKAIIDKNTDGVVNPYDIQMACFDACYELEKFLSEDELEKLKKHAYETGMQLFLYNILFSVPIRDRILNEKGFTHKDVDDNDPSQKKAAQ